jgi:hypothetical protein
MRELSRYWRVRGSRRHLFVRVFLDNPWRSFLFWWRTARRSRHYSSPVSASLRTYHGHQHNCYCPHGNTTDFRAAFFGCSVWASLSRDCTKRPCSCDKITWLLLPENHADEIADYGEAKLRAEFPGVEAI